MSRTIIIINQKGGVGKTTTTLNVGAGLTLLGKKTLLIDLDPQRSLSISLGIKETKYTTYDVIKNTTPAKKAIIELGILDLIPSSSKLSGVDLEISTIAGREFLLAEAIEKLKSSYDYVLIDSPPSLNLLTINGLTCAGELIIPLQVEYLALQGMTELLRTVDIVKKRLNPALTLAGIVATRYDGRIRLNREVIESIRGYFSDKLFNTFIRDNIALAEAPSFQKSIFTYNPASNGAIDYLSLAEEIVAQEKGR